MTTVYLLHFDQTLSQGPDPRTGKPRAAGHYIGSTDDLVGRMLQHSDGHGARIVQALIQRGGDFVLARQWEGVDRKFERHLKRRKEAPRLCPKCSPGAMKWARLQP